MFLVKPRTYFHLLTLLLLTSALGIGAMSTAYGQEYSRHLITEPASILLNDVTSFEKAPASGVLVSGWWAKSGIPDKDIYLHRLKQSGFTNWEMQYSQNGDDIAFSSKVNTEGDIITTGLLTESSTGPRPFLLKTNANDGSINFVRTYGLANGQGKAILQDAANNRYIIAGEDFDDGAIILASVRSNGTLDWINTYKDTENGSEFTVTGLDKTSEGEYIVVGTRRVPNADSDAMVLVTKSDGAFDHLIYIGGNFDDRFNDVVHIGNGSFICVGQSGDVTPGETQPSEGSHWAVRFNADLTVNWSRTNTLIRSGQFNEVELNSTEEVVYSGDYYNGVNADQQAGYVTGDISGGFGGTFVMQYEREHLNQAGMEVLDNDDIVMSTILTPDPDLELITDVVTLIAGADVPCQVAFLEMDYLSSTARPNEITLAQTNIEATQTPVLTEDDPKGNNDELCSCPRPVNLQATFLSSASVELTWDRMATTYLYDVVRYRPIGSSTWTSLTVAGSPTVTISLPPPPGVTYEWEVFTVCSQFVRSSPSRSTFALISRPKTQWVSEGTKGMELFPNPTSAKLNLTLPGEPGPHNQLEILDLQGQLILSRSMESATEQLDLTGLAPGMYLLRYTDKGLQLTEKIIKQ